MHCCPNIWTRAWFFSIINFSSHQIYSFHFDSFRLCIHLGSFIVSLTTSEFSVSTCILEHLPVRHCNMVRDGNVLHLTVLRVTCVRGGSTICAMPCCLLAPGTALPDPAACLPWSCSHAVPCCSSPSFSSQLSPNTPARFPFCHPASAVLFCWAANCTASERGKTPGNQWKKLFTWRSVRKKVYVGAGLLFFACWSKQYDQTVSLCRTVWSAAVINLALAITSW